MKIYWLILAFVGLPCLAEDLSIIDIHAAYCLSVNAPMDTQTAPLVDTPKCSTCEAV
jgi:hypothetical protein